MFVVNIREFYARFQEDYLANYPAERRVICMDSHLISSELIDGSFKVVLIFFASQAFIITFLW